MRTRQGGRVLHLFLSNCTFLYSPSTFYSDKVHKISKTNVYLYVIKVSFIKCLKNYFVGFIKFWMNLLLDQVYFSQHCTYINLKMSFNVSKVFIIIYDPYHFRGVNSFVDLYLFVALSIFRFIIKQSSVCSCISHLVLYCFSIFNSHDTELTCYSLDCWANCYEIIYLWQIHDKVKELQSEFRFEDSKLKQNVDDISK